MALAFHGALFLSRPFGAGGPSPRTALSPFHELNVHEASQIRVDAGQYTIHPRHHPAGPARREGPDLEPPRDPVPERCVRLVPLQPQDRAELPKLLDVAAKNDPCKGPVRAGQRPGAVEAPLRGPGGKGLVASVLE